MIAIRLRGFPALIFGPRVGMSVRQSEARSGCGSALCERDEAVLKAAFQPRLRRPRSQGQDFVGEFASDHWPSVAIWTKQPAKVAILIWIGL